MVIPVVQLARTALLVRRYYCCSSSISNTLIKSRSVIAAAASVQQQQQQQGLLVPRIGRMSFHFASSDYAACFLDLPKPDTQAIRASALDYLKIFDRDLWYKDPVRVMFDCERIDASLIFRSQAPAPYPLFCLILSTRLYLYLYAFFLLLLLFYARALQYRLYPL